ncbi:hypothetical protein ACAW74_16145 [Fibrella sp. WM1]|uniref:hypothetical protein n=1 Tax=Fibrella musci TaxID=3242485 RepID=UPI0035229014
MKKLLYIALVLFIAACGKKNDTVAPDAAAKIAGTYVVSRFAVSGTGANDFDFKLPQSGTLNGATVTYSATVVVTKQTETSVSMVLIEKITGQADENTEFGTADIKGSELYQGTTKVGTADGTDLNIDASGQGIRVIVTAKK